MKDLPELIRQRRKFLKLSQSEVAARAGLARGTMVKLETDRFSDLGIRKVARVCSALGLHVTAVPQRRPTLHDLIAEDVAGGHD